MLIFLQEPDQEPDQEAEESEQETEQISASCQTDMQSSDIEKMKEDFEKSKKDYHELLLKTACLLFDWSLVLISTALHCSLVAVTAVTHASCSNS